MTEMIDQIRKNIDFPEGLEKLYRVDPKNFEVSFRLLTNEFDTPLIRFWKIRLSSDQSVESKTFRSMDLLILILLSLATGFLVKIPDLFGTINENYFYPRNLAILVFNGLILYSFWQNGLFERKRFFQYGGIILTLLLYVNNLPVSQSDSINLSLLHIPIFLWFIFGWAYLSFETENLKRRIEFIRYNGDLLIMTGLILIAGVLLTAITIGLFSVIKMDISDFYLRYIAVFGAVAAPIVASWLLVIYPNLTRKIAPVIAKLFTPLVFVTLFIFLIALIFSRADLFVDRDLLILLNILIISVMAIIVFSIAELDKSARKNFQVMVLFLLAVLTVVINAIAFYAMVVRLFTGFTPNRTVVMGFNILIFIHLCLLTRRLYFSYFKNQPLEGVENAVASYLNVYLYWSLFVIFLIPFLFGMR